MRQIRMVVDGDLKELQMSEIIEQLRDVLSGVRRVLDDSARDRNFEDRVDYVGGLLTCGLVPLFSVKEEIVKIEIARDDRVRGPHLKFISRGVGLDICPRCFVCGGTQRSEGSNAYLNNISAFVSNKTDGEKIVEWFNGAARLDYREHEPERIQVKVGACDTHLPCLQKLDKLTSLHGVIRLRDIKDAANMPTAVETTEH